jgi:predicted nucleic acid-binding protein
MVSALVDSGPEGEWVLDALSVGELLAPHLMPAEVANVLRRAVSTGHVTEEAAAQAHADLLDLQVTLLPYAPFAHRAWELRERLDAYDGWYVAAAEALDARLVTLDARLASLEDLRCTVLTRPKGR